MDDNKLFVASLFFALTGIAILFFVSKDLSPTEISITKLSENDFGKLVLVKGTVKSVYSGGKFVSFSVCTSTCIKCVVFESKSRVSKGDFVSVEGAVANFEGEMEIVVDSIEVLRRGDNA